ncbi:MAG: DUF3575 domain-containing protein [Prevotella sp.]|nr:DUF3575 domain-containing protein [Prevotella sp.]
MRFLRYFLLVVILCVPSMMMAQHEVTTGDSIVSMSELWKIHKAERKERGMRPRLNTQDGRITVLSLRTNLLRWITFTPEVGLIWHCAPKWDIQINGAWTSLSLSARNRKRYALWLVSPELRRYLGRKERYYIGVQGEIGQRNYKLTGLGRQGDIYGCGLVGGYQWRVSKHTSVDLHLGVGYNWGTMKYYDHKPLFEGQTPSLTFDHEKDEQRFGINHLGISLVWDLCGRKGGRR